MSVEKRKLDLPRNRNASVRIKIAIQFYLGFDAEGWYFYLMLDDEMRHFEDPYNYSELDSLNSLDGSIQLINFKENRINIIIENSKFALNEEDTILIKEKIKEYIHMNNLATKSIEIKTYNTEFECWIYSYKLKLYK